MLFKQLKCLFLVHLNVILALIRICDTGLKKFFSHVSFRGKSGCDQRHKGLLLRKNELDRLISVSFPNKQYVSHNNIVA